MLRPFSALVVFPIIGVLGWLLCKWHNKDLRPRTSISVSLVSPTRITHASRVNVSTRVVSTTRGAKPTDIREPRNEELKYLAVMIVGLSRGFVGLTTLREFALEPWRSRSKWKMDLFLCCEAGAGRHKKLELLQQFAPYVFEFNPPGGALHHHTQLERLGVCAQRVYEHGTQHGIQYSWYVRWRPDFRLYGKVTHPADLPANCVGVRFQTVWGLANVSCSMMSFNWRKTMNDHGCFKSGSVFAKLDDQVFFVPGNHVRTHLFDLTTERAKARGTEFAAAVKVGAEIGLTVAWRLNLDQVDWCPISAAGSIPKYLDWFRKVLVAGCLTRPPYYVSCELPWKKWMVAIRKQAVGRTVNSTDHQ